MEEAESSPTSRRPAARKEDLAATWDVVIVGGGTAGCVLANRLTADSNVSVLMLEAGPDYPDPRQLPDELKLGASRGGSQPGSIHNWDLSGTITDEQRGIRLAQGKVTGGGSALNGQNMQRGFSEDFDHWAAMGNTEWSYAKVLPYFRRLENDQDFQNEYHGEDGSMPVRRRQAEPWPVIQQAFYDACIAAGHEPCPDKNGPSPAGVGVAPSNNVDGIRVSTAMAYLDPVRSRPNLTVRGNVFVTRILIEGGRAIGVEAEKSGDVFRVEAGRIVLSAGAIRSPQLLMLSGVGPADNLREFGIEPRLDLPGVGQSLWNHMGAHAAIYKVKDNISLKRDTHPDAPRFYLHYTAKGSCTPCDMMMWTAPIAYGRSDHVHGLDRGTAIDQFARIACRVSLPESAGYVKLASANPAVQPVFHLRHLSDPKDMARVRAGVRLAAELLETDAFTAVSDGRIKPTDAMTGDTAELDGWLRATLSTARHVSGTCKMGLDSEPLAVVDQYCRVKGVDGLRVVDASVMPRIPRSGSAFANVVMIAERVADWIAAD